MLHIFFGEIQRTVKEKRGISFGFTLLSTIFAVGMLVIYTKTGISTFTPTLSTKVKNLLYVCIVLGILLCIFEIKNGKYALYLLLLWTWLEFLIYEASYISNVVVGIDGNSFSVGFILTALFGFLACIFALVSAILQKREVGSGKTEEGGMKNEADF